MVDRQRVSVTGHHQILRVGGFGFSRCLMLQRAGCRWMVQGLIRKESWFQQKVRCVMSSGMPANVVYRMVAHGDELQMIQRRTDILMDQVSPQRQMGQRRSGPALPMFQRRGGLLLRPKPAWFEIIVGWFGWERKRHRCRICPRCHCALN